MAWSCCALLLMSPRCLLALEFPFRLTPIREKQDCTAN